MNTIQTTRRGALLSAVLAAIAAFTKPLTAAAKRQKWRKLGPDESVQSGDLFANRSPAEIASNLANPTKTGITDFFACRASDKKEVGSKVRNIFIPYPEDSDRGFWRFE